MSRYLVFDWGGTFMKYACMDEHASFINKGKIKSPAQTGTKEEFYAILDEVVHQYDDIEGIAISSAGVIDSNKGIIHTIGIFPFLEEADLCKELSQRYGVKVTIENDGKSAALAELWLGNLSDIDDGAVVILGTSIGGAIILDHKLRRGKRFLAGEMCTMCVDETRPEENESYVGEHGTVRLCRMVQNALSIDRTIDGEEAFGYIHADDPKALSALKEYTDHLAMFLYDIYVVLDLEKIVIGGGISEQPILLEYLQQSVQDLRKIHPDLKKGIDYPLPVVDVCKFHNDANLIGALYHFLYE